MTIKIGDKIETKDDGTYLVWEIKAALRIVIGFCPLRGAYRQFDFRELRVR